MGYFAYKYPFNTMDQKPTIYLQIFRILLLLAVLAGAYMVYNNATDTDQIKLAQKDLLISQQKVEVGQKDLQIAQLTLNINQANTDDKITYLTRLNDSQRMALNKLRSNDSISTSSLSFQMVRFKKSNDSLREKESNPLLDITPENYPIIKSSWHEMSNVLVFVISEVIEKSVAINLDIKSGLLSIQGNDSLYQVLHFSSQKSNVIYYDKGYASGVPLNIKSESFSTQKTYFCLEVNYTNRNGSIQKPLIKIFNITNQLDQRFIPIYDITYDKILSFIISKKYF